MSSRGHFTISVVKSIIRIIACIIALSAGSLVALVIGLLVAEILGILEEMVDDRSVTP